MLVWSPLYPCQKDFSYSGFRCQNNQLFSYCTSGEIFYRYTIGGKGETKKLVFLYFFFLFFFEFVENGRIIGGREDCVWLFFGTKFVWLKTNQRERKNKNLATLITFSRLIIFRALLTKARTVSNNDTSRNSKNNNYNKTKLTRMCLDCNNFDSWFKRK